MKKTELIEKAFSVLNKRETRTNPNYCNEMELLDVKRVKLKAYLLKNKKAAT